jgi:hypothetical protein
MSNEKEPGSRRKFSYLPLTLSIETLGGIATPFILRGTPLPARRTKTFSTADDNQESIEIKVLMGESPIAQRDLHVASFTLGGIPQARRGEPQIVVTFEVDRECKVKVSAVEKRSGSKISAESEDAQPHLSDHEIRQLLQQAETNRAEDQKWLKLAEARVRAEEVIDMAEARLRESQEVGLSGTMGEIEQALARLGLALQQGDNPEKIHARAGELEKLVQYQKGPAPFSGPFDDFFAAIFGTPLETGSKPTRGRATEARPPPKDTISKRTSQEMRPASELAASQRIGDQIGKIFGGGEFTLDPNLGDVPLAL